jgi:hypothetical protein
MKTMIENQQRIWRRSLRCFTTGFTESTEIARIISNNKIRDFICVIRGIRGKNINQVYISSLWPLVGLK